MTININTLRDAVAEAIRHAAANNPHCSVVPGRFVATLYADAAISTISRHTNLATEPWHGKAAGDTK